MKRYETVIDIINEGEGPYDAAERAGYSMDASRIENGTVISCGSTCLIRNTGREGEAFYRYSGRDKWRTRVYITNTAGTDLEAAEKANDLFDISTMPARSSVIWLFTHTVSRVGEREYLADETGELVIA